MKVCYQTTCRLQVHGLSDVQNAVTLAPYKDGSSHA